MNRAVVSIPSNISEGAAKSSDKHFKVVWETSVGTAFEWETPREIARVENYVKDNDYNESH